MANPPRPAPRSAGVFLALALIIGAVAGTLTGQPTLGVLGGFAVGILACLIVWLKDRR